MSTAASTKPLLVVEGTNSTFVHSADNNLDLLDEYDYASGDADDICSKAEANGIWDAARPEPTIPDTLHQFIISDESSDEHWSDSNAGDSDDTDLEGEPLV